jgi:small GTP-binding protein
MEKNNEAEKEEIAKGIIKIILLGESGVGKSALISAYNGDPFSENSLSNSQSSFIFKKLTINNNNYGIQVWDTAGQEKYRSVNKIFIKDSNIVIFVYDITNRKSFLELKFWTNYIKELLGKNITIGIAANKIDLFDTEKENVSKEEGQKLAEEQKAIFKQTSAKKDREGFENFINELIKKFLLNNPYFKTDTISLGEKHLNKKKERNCC